MVQFWQVVLSHCVLFCGSHLTSGSKQFHKVLSFRDHFSLVQRFYETLNNFISLLVYITFWLYYFFLKRHFTNNFYSDLKKCLKPFIISKWCYFNQNVILSKTYIFSNYQLRYIWTSRNRNWVCVAFFIGRDLCSKEFYLVSKNLENILFDITEEKFYCSRIFDRPPNQSNGFQVKSKKKWDISTWWF